MSDGTTGSWPQSRKPNAVFIDRCLGKRLPRGLAILGFSPLLMRDVYLNDGHRLEDPLWIYEAANAGYPIITSDKKIWVNPDEVDAVRDSGAKVFVVGRNDIPAAEAALIIGRHFLTIRRRMRKPGGCLWVLYPLKSIDKRHDEHAPRRLLRR